MNTDYAKAMREVEEALQKSVRSQEDELSAWFALEEAVYALLSALKAKENNRE